MLFELAAMVDGIQQVVDLRLQLGLPYLALLVVVLKQLVLLLQVVNLSLQL